MPKKKMSKKAQNKSSTTEDKKFSIMDSLISNPGLTHVAEQIFDYLKNETLLSCLLVSKEWNTFLTNESRLLSWRKLEWLHNKEFDTARWGARYCRMHSILTLFPDWINVLNYFKKNGTLEDLKEVVTFLDLYFEKYENDSGPYMKSPIFAAAGFDQHHNILEILFKAQIEVDFNPKNAVQDPSIEAVYTPIEGAVSDKDFKTMKLFLDNTDLVSTVSVHFICSAINPDNFKLLLSHEKGKKLDFKTLDSDGLSVLFWACLHHGYTDGPEVLKMLLDRIEEFDLDVNLTANYATPVQKYWYHENCLEDYYLLEKLRKNGKCEVGKGTALHAACWVGNLRSVKLLLDQAKQLNINVAATDTYGRTILHIAAICQHVEFMDLFLPLAKEFGIDLKAKDWQGHTFFQSACVSENRELVTHLVDQAKKYGFEIDPKDEQGRDWFDTIEDHPALLIHDCYSGNEMKKREAFVLFFQDLICKK